MDLSINWKCSTTVAILTVLVYLLLVTILKSNSGEDSGKSMEETEWFKSMEFLLFVAAFIAYWVNSKLFQTC
jgi:uncharacterized membrane protein AbrB (regulator of aidB expression)